MLKHYNKNSNSLREKPYSSSEQSCSQPRKVYFAFGKTYSRKISCFSIARVCCKLSGVCLFLLASLLINPTTTSAYAFDSAPDDSGTGNTGNTDSNSSSSTITSTVNIAFTPESGSASLTPISADGASAKYSIKATVGVENSGGYTVYLGSNKSELTGKNTGATINGVTSSSTYEELPLNTWGYNAIEGETPGTTFSKVPTNNRGDIIASNSSTNIKEDNKTFTLSFAAHIGNDKPADTYENEITLSVVSSPLEVTNDFGISTMQEMTSTVCSNAKDLDEDGEISAQLEDVRDGKYYWVNKLADGKCWMTQNLDLDLSTSVALTPEDSDVTANWTPGYATATAANASTVNSKSQTETRSWDLGDYRIISPTTSNSCGSAKNDISQCLDQFTVYATPSSANNDKSAHYIVGNYYQWNTATAGTGGTLTNGVATGSICPKGWRMPESNVATAGSFNSLISTYNIGSNVAKLTSAPLYFVRGGAVDQNTSTLFSYAGSYGFYWSATPHSGGSTAYNLLFYNADGVAPSNGNYRNSRNYGFSVRCVNKTSGFDSTPEV